MKVSVIIPVFNEAKVLGDCLKSLLAENFQDYEIIVVDDGSKDRSLDIAKQFKTKIFHQKHKGPGAARNLGVKHARGQVIVFVDADMTFDKNFIKKLTEPIFKGQTIGTFSKEEYVTNPKKRWSQAWNINKKLPIERMHPENYPSEQAVFRAILKSEFEKVGGFKTIGYIDDYTLSEKLGIKAIAAPGAIFYHRNPETFGEVWRQARWVGKSEFKRRKIRIEFIMRFIAIFRYSLPVSLIKGILIAIKNKKLFFIWFKVIYDLAVEVSLWRSFLREQRYR